MRRSNYLLFAALIALTSLLGHAQDQTFPLDKRGFVTNWLVAVPVPLAEQRGAAVLDSDVAKTAAKLKPKAGDKIQVGGKSFDWKTQVADRGKLDFNPSNGTATDNCMAFAVCYVVAEAATPSVIALTGSDDQIIVFVNGKEVSRFTGPRGFRADEDVSNLFTLNAGSNTILMIVVNGGGGFAGSLSLANQTGNPLQNIKVTLTPPK